MTQTRTDPTTTEELPVVAAAPEQVVTVNGVDRPWTPALTVQAVVVDLLGTAGGTADGPAAPLLASCATASAPTGVAAALDDTIVPRGLWATTSVPAGARVEVVTAVQGG